MDCDCVFLEGVENGERESTGKQAIVVFERLLVNASVKPKRFDVSVEIG